MAALGDWTVCAVVLTIFLHGLLSGADVFDAFLTGAREGAETAVKILPALVALITAVGVLRASGLLDLLTGALAPLFTSLGLPREVIPLALLRPVSGSGAMVIFTDILEKCGPDSFAGRVASVMQGSTETTFYTVAVYYGAVSIHRTRHTVPSALTADVTGFLMSAAAVRLFFG